MADNLLIKSEIYDSITPTEWPPVGQMTIFYDGKVNVYEGIPPEKARLIMQLAGSPNNCYLPFEVPPAASYQETRAFVSRLPSDAYRANGRPLSPTMLGVMSSPSAQQQTGMCASLGNRVH
ncbi:1,2-dihydroxy-3-keto-5-methylthiopentene dioxygenase [Asimina triloba]